MAKHITKLIGDDFTQEERDRWYDEEAAFHNQYVGGRTQEYPFFEHYSHLIFGLNHLLKDGLTVLDFGCAEGLTLSRMNKSFDYHGVDASESLLEYAKSRNPQSTFKPIGKDLNIPYPNGTFDLVLCFGVLHHIPQVSIVLKEFQRVLKPNGVAFIREPITDMKKLDGTRPGLSPNERGLPVDWMVQSCEAAGLKVENIQLCRFGPLNMLQSKLGAQWHPRLMTWLDKLVSRFYSPARAQYSRTQFVQKLAPNAAYFTVRKQN